MTQGNVAAIVLAAGQGTRMKSELHKVLHPIGGKPMVHHVLSAAEAINPAKTILVVGAKAEQLKAAVPNADFALQTEQKGTGHAVQMALPALEGFTGDLLVLYGDIPLLPAGVLEDMIKVRQTSPDVGLVVLGFEAADPAAYGRLVLDTDGGLERIVEFKDASEDERAIALCNSGMMLIDGSKAKGWLSQLSSDNAAGEFYLTDLVAIARGEGAKVAVTTTEEANVAGVNSRADLADAEALFQAKKRAEFMAAGVTLQAPETVFFSHDTQIGKDVTIEPNVVIGPGAVIEDDVSIKAFSHIEGAHVRRDASVGPFARLRPAADIGEGAKIGNFVEIKKSKLAEGVKVSHLTYLGDASVGAEANIGAGTITCNYDGFLKYQTTIGKGAFIGSNSSLVAPVTIGDGAITGAGSVITGDAPVDSLAVSRAKQRNIDGYAAKFRAKKQAEKAAKSNEKKG